MYAIHFPENVAKVIVFRCWNLGDIYITAGVVDLLEHEDFVVELPLIRHWAGDYGLVSMDELDHQQNTVNREEGRRFTSLFEVGEDCLKVVTLMVPRRTVVCLTSED